MRILLDTNILIHREASAVVRDDIGGLFRWLDRLKHDKCVHQASLDEIRKHADPQVVRTFTAKISSYEVLKTTAPDAPAIAALRNLDQTPNEQIDTSMLAELVAGRVDALITEDRGIHRKAAQVGRASDVFTIDSFLEKVTTENPDLVDYKVLSVRKRHFGNVNLKDTFFDTFREDYPGFDHWFNRKANELAYVCTGDDGGLLAFLYVKKEEPGEDYSDIRPSFSKAVRLKIGTFKVVSNGFKLGERFLRIVFENALRQKAEEIYVTIFRKRSDQDRLVRLLQDWGFLHHGQKRSAAGAEEVFVRDFRPRADLADPRRTYPYISRKARKFIVPIWPQYHTELLPDSILKTEQPEVFSDSKPNRNAMHKVYISRSIERGMKTGDILVFYRTSSKVAPAYYTAVATTLAVVQETATTLKSQSEFVQYCRRRGVFTDEELAAHWNYKPHSRPFAVSFLYVHSLRTRPNLRDLMNAGILRAAPRGFEQLSDSAFEKLMEISGGSQRLVVD
jgi:predicted nucleic acid-binding protein